MGEACSTNGEKRNPYKILVAKPEGKRPQDELVCTGLNWLRIGTSGGLL
jgi:hypothetical protein